MSSRTATTRDPRRDIRIAQQQLSTRWHSLQHTYPHEYEFIDACDVLEVNVHTVPMSSDDAYYNNDDITGWIGMRETRTVRLSYHTLTDTWIQQGEMEDEPCIECTTVRLIYRDSEQDSSESHVTFSILLSQQLSVAGVTLTHRRVFDEQAYEYQYESTYDDSVLQMKGPLNQYATLSVNRLLSLFGLPLALPHLTLFYLLSGFEFLLPSHLPELCDYVTQLCWNDDLFYSAVEQHRTLLWDVWRNDAAQSDEQLLTIQHYGTDVTAASDTTVTSSPAIEQMLSCQDMSQTEGQQPEEEELDATVSRFATLQVQEKVSSKSERKMSRQKMEEIDDVADDDNTAGGFVSHSHVDSSHIHTIPDLILSYLTIHDFIGCYAAHTLQQHLAPSTKGNKSVSSGGKGGNKKGGKHHIKQKNKNKNKSATTAVTAAQSAPSTLSSESQTITIRACTERDIPCITRIFSQYVSETTYVLEDDAYSEQWWRDTWHTAVKANHPFYVAVDSSNTVVGFSYVHPFRARCAYRYSIQCELYVTEEHRSSVATQLFATTLTHLQQHTAIKVVLIYAIGTDTQLIQHLQSLSFSRTGRLPGIVYKLNSWHDLHWYQLQLAEQTDDPTASEQVKQAQSTLPERLKFCWPKPTFSVRDSSEEDVEAITAIYNYAIAAGTGTFEESSVSAEEMRTRRRNVLQKGFPYFVAVNSSGGEVVGYCYLGPFHSAASLRYAVEDSIYIHPAYHGHGVGTLLLTRALQWLEGREYRALMGCIGDSENTGSVALHRKAECTDQGCLQKVGYKFGRWLDVVMTQKQLMQNTVEADEHADTDTHA